QQPTQPTNPTNPVRTAAASAPDAATAEAQPGAPSKAPTQAATADNKPDGPKLERLSMEEVNGALAGIRGALQDCAKNSTGGDVQLKFKVMPDGNVESATAQGAEGSVGSCMEGIVK